jgi:glycosyltransferase involved in cell wall biosynthesis
MKILHVIDSEGVYGAEVVVLNLMAEHRTLGHDPWLCSIGATGIAEKPLETEALRRGLKVFKVRMRNGPNLVGAIQLLQLAKQGGFEIIHSHGYKSNILLGFVPGRLRGIPLVATVHGWTSSGRLSRLIVYEWLDRISLRFMDIVVLVSRTMQSKVKVRAENQARVMVIHNGIPPSSELPFQPSPDEEISTFCRGSFTLGSVGRLSPEKGYDVLIRAVNTVVGRGLPIKLVILGEGQERTKLERLIADCGLTERVSLPGYKHNARDYIPLFDVFVLSSFTEGLPITLLEAMGSGRPIVATKVGSIPDVLDGGKAGLLVDPNQSAALADALESMVNDGKLRQSLARRAVELSSEQYSSRRMAEQYLCAYEKAQRASLRSLVVCKTAP